MTPAPHAPSGLAPGSSGRSRRAALGAAAALLLAACSRKEAPGPAPAAAPSPDPGAAAAAAKAAYEKASGGSGFVVGQAMAARSLLVFFDPQCPHCAALWKAATPLRDKMRMTWMPVAFMRPVSAPQGAALLAAADPVKTMDEHEALLEANKGGLPTQEGANPDGLKKVEANTALWKEVGTGSVPHMIWRAGSDGPYGSNAGGMDTARLQQVLGL